MFTSRDDRGHVVHKMDAPSMTSRRLSAGGADFVQNVQDSDTGGSENVAEKQIDLFRDSAIRYLGQYNQG